MDKFPKNKKDSTGRYGTNLGDLIGAQFMHGRNQRLYRVIDVVWYEDTGTWSIAHVTVGSLTTFVASADNFLGKFEDGSPRFIKVNE